MISKYMKLVRRFIIISWQEIYVFKFELSMVLLHLIFNTGFVFLFWYSLLSNIKELGGWNFSQLAMFSAITLFGESLGGLFFGFRDLPSKIVAGSLDKYLSRPINTLFAVLFESVSIVYFIQQFLVSLILIVIVAINSAISIKVSNIALSIIVMLIGVLIYNFIYGIITFTAFWFGKIEVFRGLILGLAESKQYPLNIFPNKMKIVLTYIVPIAFISYYPAVILLGKMSVNFMFFVKLFIFYFITFGLFIKIWRLGIKRYESNGG
ncbi:ABC transporter permease [Abyssisolibacter fermentans]|uniref:ABC transporter permease n=1 Tax=Abyssisolibacter fermentans TaxID=1766203 RepID=UPI0008379FC0|nr:ABC-2 family transporter protein [Abyssisolibacter fermentans]